MFSEFIETLRFMSVVDVATALVYCKIMHYCVTVMRMFKSTGGSRVLEIFTMPENIKIKHHED